MAFRALLFSKSTETNAALNSACHGAGIRLEVCEDIFSAMEKGTKHPFSCILVDWSDQPEAGFLLKRSRESTNANAVTVAIVDSDPKPAEMQEHRLNFLIYRPVAITEAQEVLAKATESMQGVSAAEIPAAAVPADSAPANTEPPAQSPDSPPPGETVYNEDPNAPEANLDGDAETSEEITRSSGLPFSMRQACAAALVLGAAYCLWTARATIGYLAHTRENKVTVFREAVAALFYMNPSGATSVGAAGTDAQQDAYFSRSAATSTADQPHLGIAASEAEVSESKIQLRKPSDFPLPSPVYERPVAPPVETRRATVPDSLRSSASITPPVVVTVTPAQMMPVSAPAVPPPISNATQQFSEPVTVTEQAARALLLQSAPPAYPAAALPQKLHGPVVLQATIGRDGTVEDLKIVRGPFILCKAAIAAVKQWRFQPYTVSGKPAQTQTLITINFTPPAG
jgi:TonB family protein